jgi:hypothetical protein
MNKIYLILTFLTLTMFQVFSQTKPVKCDQDKFDNRRTSNSERNRQISEACAAIDNGDYSTASSLLEQAILIEPDAYFEKVNKQLKQYINESVGSTGEEKSGKNKKEKKEAPEPEKVPDAPVFTKTETQPEKTAEPKPEVTNPAPIEKPVAEPVAKTEDKPAASETIEENPLKSDVKERVFTTEELKSFQDKGQMKLNLFKQYLDKIASRNISRDDGLMAISNALKLFYGTETYVQVSSVNNPNKPKVRTKMYLERVRALNYDKIEIGWADFQYSPNLRKGPDGNYYGYISFRQRFRGSKDGKVVYEDVTDKTIAVILKVYDKYVEGVSTENFEVFLGDMDVVQTSRE